MFKSSDNQIRGKNSYRNFKARDLKVFNSLEWLAESKRKYRTVFDQSEITYVYVEFSFYNKLFDEEDWQAKVTLKAYNVTVPNSPVSLCELKYDKEISKEDNIVFINDSWGNDTPGSYWKKGIYTWEAWIDDELVMTKYFYVENFGKLTKGNNPYFKVASLKLFEEPSGSIPREERVYYKKFKADETRYIMFEFVIESLHPETPWYGEFFFNYYNDVRQLKAQIVEVKHISVSNQNKFYYIENGWGSDSKTFWYKDKYTLEVVFMDQLIAVIPFEVGDEFEEGATKPLIVVEEDYTQYETPQKDLSEEEVLKEMEMLIGLESIKKRIKEYRTYLNFLKLRTEKGIEDTDKINLYAVFTGNPGTGKTTVAKLLGRIYKSMGLLSKGAVHEVDRSDLIGEFIGQTAPKVREVINKARGGILFIDEAYALARTDEDKKDFGREAIEILIKEMSDGPGDLAIIVAGYPKEMEIFINSNPGLKSRFNLWYEFPDYVPQELIDIAEYAANKRALIITSKARDFLYKKVVEAYRNRDRFFGNARYVNSLIDEAKLNLGLRIMNHPNPEKLSPTQLSTIKLEDVQKIFEDKERIFADIPIDEELLREVMDELNSLVDLNSIKHDINELIKLVRFYKEVKKDVLNSFSLHNVFVGNPGTGKTTLARLMAKIYKALGLLEKGHLVECSRDSLVAGYVGQTAIKTAEKIQEAKGGVLFIDEAYSLTYGSGQSDYGHEAIEVILKKMEDMRGEFAIIAAGYTQEMKVFLDSNPGLRSRFDSIYKFEDYTPQELMDIALKMFQDESVEPNQDAKKHLEKYFEFHYKDRDKFFGNARVVRKVVLESIKNQQLRLSSISPESRTEEMLHKITYQDVEEFLPRKDLLMGQQGKTIGFVNS